MATALVTSEDAWELYMWLVFSYRYFAACPKWCVIVHVQVCIP